VIRRAIGAAGGLLVAVATAAAAPASAPPGSAPPIEVTGATFAELDERAGIWTLRGAPVVLRRGEARIEAQRVVYETGPRIVRASGAVTYRDATLEVTAARLTAWLEEERLLAEGGVTARAPEGRLSAGRVEALAAREELVAEEDARLVHEDLEGRAARIVLQRRLALATLSGGAVVRRGASESRAATIVVDLRRQRITARGGAVVTLVPDR
jgi:lipopolysaccharide export system protein LptA